MPRPCVTDERLPDGRSVVGHCLLPEVHASAAVGDVEDLAAIRRPGGAPDFGAAIREWNGIAPRGGNRPQPGHLRVAAARLDIREPTTIRADGQVPRRGEPCSGNATRVVCQRFQRQGDHDVRDWPRVVATNSVVPSFDHCGALELLPVEMPGKARILRGLPPIAATMIHAPRHRRDPRRTRSRGRRATSSACGRWPGCLVQVHRLAAPELSHPDVVVADKIEADFFIRLVGQALAVG